MELDDLAVEESAYWASCVRKWWRARKVSAVERLSHANPAAFVMQWNATRVTKSAETIAQTTQMKAQTNASMPRLEA